VKHGESGGVRRRNTTGRKTMTRTEKYFRLPMSQCYQKIGTDAT
jgi:hypothetical protein